MKRTPRIEINLEKIKHNASTLRSVYGKKGVQITAVVKGVCANIKVAKAILASGITSLADAKITNIEKMKKAGLKATFLLLRTPALSEIQKVVEYADISMNTEIEVIRALSKEAVKQKKIHRIIIMVEMGDLREGILLKDSPSFIEEVLKLPGIQIVGIGTNFACFGGIVPTQQKMEQFSSFVQTIKKRFSLDLPYITGGNSANHNWLMHTNHVGLVNNLRIGELLLLGKETATGKYIPNLYHDAFQFFAEVIETKIKPSVPFGSRGKNAFGETVRFKNRGWRKRVIVGVGRQDIQVSGLTPIAPVKILGASSDHIILDANDFPIKIGEEIAFSVNYEALISAMTSPYIYKEYTFSTPIVHYDYYHSSIGTA